MSGNLPCEERENLVIRGTEGRELVSALDSALQARGGIVEISGDPGTGKTRLLRDLMDEAERRGLLVLSGACSRPQQEIPFESFMQLLTSRPLADLAKQLPDDHLDELCRAITALRACRQNKNPCMTSEDRYSLYYMMRTLLGFPVEEGMLIVIDDFHWADSVSTELVETLARWPLKAPLLIAIGQRPRQASPRLRRALTNGVELGTVRRVELGPLDVAQSAQLLNMPENHPHLRILHSRSSGIPAYLLALSDGDIQPSVRVPGEIEIRPAERFKAFVEGELESLTEREYHMAATAAILGDHCDLEILQLVAEVDQDTALAEMETLLRHDILRRTDTAHGLSLRHPLLGDLILAGVEVGWQRAAHRRAATVLARWGASATELAWHLEQSGARPDGAGLRILLDAAAECLPCSPGRAVHWLERALDAAPEETTPDMPDRVDVLLRLAHALCAAHRLSDGRERLAEVLRITTPQDGHRRAAAAQLAGIVECLLGNHREALALLDAELAAVKGGLPPHLVDLVINRGVLTYLEGRAADRESIEAALGHARGRGGHLAEAGLLALSVLSDLCGDGDPLADERLDTSVALFDRMADADIARHPEYLAILAWVETLVGRFAEAARHFKRSALIARANGDGHVLPLLLLGQANACRHLGRLREARGLAHDARHHAGAMSIRWLRGLVVALESQLLLLGPEPDRAAAVSLAENALSELTAAGPHIRFVGVIALAAAVGNAGEHHRCFTLLVDAGGGPELPRIPRIVRPMCFELIASAVSDIEESPAIWAERLRACALTNVLPHHKAYALITEAHANRANGDYVSATGAYAHSAQLFSRVGMVCAEARALVSAARCGPYAGRRADVPSFLALAGELAGRSGSDRIFEETSSARAEFEATALSEEEAGSDELAILTEREREIAEIAGMGAKTRDIATQLCLSPRTVDVHLTRIYRKLNISSRAALARLMARRASATRLES